MSYFFVGPVEGKASPRDLLRPKGASPGLKLVSPGRRTCELDRPELPDKKHLWDFKIVGDLLLRSTLKKKKTIEKFVLDFKKSASLYVWEFDMNSP